MIEFEDVTTPLRGLPITWYPAILQIVVTEAVRAGTFLEGKIPEFVDRQERRARLEHAKGTESPLRWLICDECGGDGSFLVPTEVPGVTDITDCVTCDGGGRVPVSSPQSRGENETSE